MDINTINEYGKDLEQIMRLRTQPIALKWYERVEDVPKEAVFPKRDLKKHMALCQAFSYARMKGMTVAMTKEDHWCWNPLVGFGQVDSEPGSPAFEEIVKFIGIADRDKANKFFAGFPRLPKGKYAAVVVAPLAGATLIPDVVIIYGDTAQLNHMIRSIKSAIGGTFTSEFDGIDSCIYCTVPSFEKNEYRVTFPDPGDRERARAGDDEAILTVPFTRMEEFMSALRKSNRFMGFNQKLFDFNLDFARPPFYNKLFDVWGLDKGEDWSVK
jgi:uncharacterized protein (DUF169 family)